MVWNQAKVFNELFVKNQNKTPCILLKKELSMLNKRAITMPIILKTLYYTFLLSMKSSLQLLEAWYNLPYQSSSTSYYSVCMILISSNVVNERQNKFYSGLYQHHIRYKRKRRSDELVPHLAGLHPLSKFPNCLLPSGRCQTGEQTG